MSGELSNAGADLLLNALFRRDTNPSWPTSLYLGLATAAVADTTALSAVTEASDATYARQQLTSSNMGAPADVSGVETVKNSATVSFSFTTGGTAITYAFLTDAASGTSGSVYAWWQLTTSKTPGAGDTLQFTANNIAFGVD